MIPVTVFFFVALSACDTLVSASEDPESEESVAARMEAVPGLLKATQASGSVSFNDLLHHPLGRAGLNVTNGDCTLYLRIFDIGPSGKDGFRTDLEGARRLQRAFESIDLSENGAAASWKLFSDAQPAAEVHLQNQGGTVGMQVDLAAALLGPGGQHPPVTVGVYLDSILVHKTALTVVKDIYIDELMGSGNDIVLKEVGAQYELAATNAPSGFEAALELAFLWPVEFNIQDNRVTGNRVRLVVPGGQPLAFSHEAWHFVPELGSSRMDVVSTDLVTE